MSDDLNVSGIAGGLPDLDRAESKRHPLPGSWVTPTPCQAWSNAARSLRRALHTSLTLCASMSASLRACLSNSGRGRSAASWCDNCELAGRRLRASVGVLRCFADLACVQTVHI